MSKNIQMIVEKGGPVKTGPAEHGAWNGTSWIYGGQIIEVLVDDTESPHDGWVRISGPDSIINDDGTYKNTGREGWFELTHLSLPGSGDKQYLLTIPEEGNPTIVRIK